MAHRLFSYGPLRQGDVQVALSGRPVPTVEDSLAGHRLDWLVITDPGVIAASGSDRHPILRKGSPGDSAWAVGSVSVGGGDMAVIEHWDGKAWTWPPGFCASPSGPGCLPPASLRPAAEVPEPSWAASRPRAVAQDGSDAGHSWVRPR